MIWADTQNGPGRRVNAGEVREGQFNAPCVALCIPAPDHGEGGLNVGPG
jgi:hypothetical protein